MISGYTTNLSVQIVISLLKQHGIKKIIISPGTTDLEFSAGVQYSKEFELYSSVDERSAAYMACGMAEESGEAVAIVCTEATASRNYYSGLTEAYYRKLPILAITGVHRYSKIGHLHSQIIDRSVSPVDTVRFKAQLPIIRDKEDITETEILVNKAILELKRNGGGPVHIDLPCCNDSYDFSCKNLYLARKINRYVLGEKLPSLPQGRIAIFAGSHTKYSEDEQSIINQFCEIYNAVIFSDHTSGIKGKYVFHSGILAVQSKDYDIFNNIDILIHIGEGTGDEPTVRRLKSTKEVWRVNPDGEIRDLFEKLSTVYQMKEIDFFKYHISTTVCSDNSYIELCEHTKNQLTVPYDLLPLSNVYMASKISADLPGNSVIHMGVSNTIRAWTLFDFPETVEAFSNVGCRGIDGCVSALVGASIINPEQLHLGVFGDLTFFYDMNSIGNRQIKENIRILLINNGGGGVFKLSGAPGYRFFGDESTNEYIAAAGHYGNKSPILVKNYAEALGFEYISATNKSEFDEKYKKFLSKEVNKPMLFEVFTTDEDERNAFSVISSIETTMTSHVKEVAKQILGEKGKKFVKNIITRE